MTPAAFCYHAPASLEEALALLHEHGEEAKILAGGHSLLPAMKLRLAAPRQLIDLRRLRGELDFVREVDGAVVIGALTTHEKLASSDTVRRLTPVLAQTASCVGDMQVRNMGTLGGSLAHADPAGDPPAAVLAAEAELVVQGSGGARTTQAGEFFFGFFTTALEPGEVLTEVRIKPAGQGSGSSYQKFANPASGYAVCGVAAVVSRDGDKVASCRIGITGVSDGAYRADAVERAVVGESFADDLVTEASRLAADGVEPLEDSYAGADYRRHLAAVLTKRAIEEAWRRTGATI